MPHPRAGPTGRAPSSVTASLLLVAAVAAAVASPHAAASGATPGSWRWPLDPRPLVLARFEAPAGTYGPGHRGVDLEARVGQPVLAAGAGVVAFAGMVAGRGVVSVDHAGGRRTTYEPVAAVVIGGAPVVAGALLGTVTSAPGHCLPGTCLHWGLRLDETYLDPLGLVGALEVRLLPVWSVRGPSPPREASGSAPVTITLLVPTTDRGPLLARG